MKHLRIFLPAVFLVLLTAFAFVPVDARGQDPADMPTLVEHLQSELQSNAAMRRHLALLDVAALAHCPNDCHLTLHTVQGENLRTTERADLRALTPELLACYRRGPEDGHRLLALWALVGIGDEGALATLVEEGTRQSDRVNRETQRSLAAFYLERYPELSRQSAWTGEITLEDIDRAQRVRIKKAAKEAADRG